MHFRAQKKTAQNVSLSDRIETTTDGTALSLMDVIGDEEDLMDRVCDRQMLRILCKAIDEKLDEQERQVILMRYGLGGYTAGRQREVAQAIGISRSYVSRIEKRALQKLRRALEEK